MKKWINKEHEKRLFRKADLVRKQGKGEGTITIPLRKLAVIINMVGEEK